MTYENAANALVDAGLIDKADASAAVSVLESPTIDMTYPAWAAALAKAGLIDQANVSTAADVMQKESMKAADDDPDAFDDALANAGIL